MKGFSIIIVTWNGLHHLKTFLPSVTKTEYPDFEIILADNASSDDTVEWVKEHHPEVIISTFDDNYGYCGGNNKAVPSASKEILLFLNNDVQVDENWLYGINNAFEKDKKIGAVQPKMLSFERPDYFEYAGAAGGFIDKYGYPFAEEESLIPLKKDEGQFEDSTEIFWASGAALAIKKDIFEKLGGFDEDFEFHMEEIDLCWRIKRAGHKIIYTPESNVYHLGGGSLPMGSPRKVYYNFRNNLFMLWKNYSTSELIFKFPIRWSLDVIAAWKALLSGKPNEFLAIAKAHLHFILGWSSINRKRKNISLPTPSTLTAKISFSLIFHYFISGKKPSVNYLDMNVDKFKDGFVPFLKKWGFSLLLIFCSWFIIKQFWWALRFNIFFAVSYDHVFGFNLFYFLLDNLVLIIHEAGHTIFSIFGWRFLTVLGGTLLQLLIPFAVFMFSWLNRKKLLAQCSLYWLGFCWLDTASYCADAYLRQMPLIGGLPKSAHDFFNILNMLNLMEHHKTIAWIMFSIGVIILLLGIIWPFISP